MRTVFVSLLVAFFFPSVVALAPNVRRPTRYAIADTRKTNDENGDAMVSRRSLFSACAATVSLWGACASISRADTGAEVRGTQVNAFNGLIFNYRGNEFGGLKASDIDEPSVSYADFMGKLKEGKVQFVEFVAPDGDKAYATFLGDDGKAEAPLRIGEGMYSPCAPGTYLNVAM